MGPPNTTLWRSMSIFGGLCVFGPKTHWSPWRPMQGVGDLWAGGLKTHRPPWAAKFLCVATHGDLWPADRPSKCGAESMQPQSQHDGGPAAATRRHNKTADARYEGVYADGKHPAMAIIRPEMAVPPKAWQRTLRYWAPRGDNRSSGSFFLDKTKAAPPLNLTTFLRAGCVFGVPRPIGRAD